MQLNSLIFPAPQRTYCYDDIGMFYIPNQRKHKSESRHIPCQFIQYQDEELGFSHQFMVFFHGNAEDIGIAYDFLKCLQNYLKMNIISVEYPGYGLYYGSSNEEYILEDCQTVYDFMVDNLKIREKDIILLGRSIGSGPVTYLANHNRPGLVILISPFTCIKDTVKFLVGEYLAYLVADRFNNLELIGDIKSPLFIIHGEMDDIIPITQSQQLYTECVKKNKKCHFWFPPNMDHNNYHLEKDIVIPIRNFIKIVKYNLTYSYDYFFTIKDKYQKCSDPKINEHTN